MPEPELPLKNLDPPLPEFLKRLLGSLPDFFANNGWYIVIGIVLFKIVRDFIRARFRGPSFSSAQLSAFEAERARVYRERFGAKEGGVSESSSRQRKPAENNKGVAHIADETAFASVLDNHSKVVAYFTAQWCGPCRRLSPEYEKLAAQYPVVKFVKVDVDEAQALATLYEITAMPTLVFFHNGVRLGFEVGANLPAITSQIKKLFEQN